MQAHTSTPRQAQGRFAQGDPSSPDKSRFAGQAGPELHSEILCDCGGQISPGRSRMIVFNSGMLFNIERPDSVMRGNFKCLLNSAAGIFLCCVCIIYF